MWLQFVAAQILSPNALITVWKLSFFYTCWIEEMLIVPHSWSCGSADSLDKQATERQHSLWNFA